MAFLAGLLSRFGTWILGFFLDYFVRKIQAVISEWKAKREDEKKVEDAKEKIVNGDLKTGLDGASDLEDHINRNA